MNKKAYKALEYYKIIDLLTDKASSPMGKDLCRKLTPSTDIEEIRSMQLQTHDALARLFKKGGISFGSVKDIRGTLKRLTVGSALNAPELLSVCSLLENTGRVKAYSRSDRDDGMTDSLDGMFAALEPLTPLSTEIRRCILSRMRSVTMPAARFARSAAASRQPMTGYTPSFLLWLQEVPGIIFRIPLSPCATAATVSR